MDRNPRLNLCFNATIHSANYQELPALAEFLRDEFRCNLNFSILVGTPRDSSLVLPSEADLKKTRDALEAVVVNQPTGGHGFHTTHVYDGFLYVHSGSAENVSHTTSPGFSPSNV